MSLHPATQSLPVVEEDLRIRRERTATGALRVRIETHESTQELPLESWAETAEVERVRRDQPVDQRRASWLEGDVLAVPAYQASPAAVQQELPMRQTVVGVFDHHAAAQHAADILRDRGIDPDSVRVARGDEDDDSQLRSDRGDEGGVLKSIKNFFSDLFGDEDHDDISTYSELVRRGGAVVKVTVDEEPEVEVAREALQSAGAIDIDEQARSWQDASTAPTGAVLSARQSTAGTATIKGGQDLSAGADLDEPASTSAPSLSASPPFDDDVIPVLREEVVVGTRTVEAGRVRIYARTVEEPVRESVQPREERAVEPTQSSLDPSAGTAGGTDDRNDFSTRHGAQAGRYEDFEPAYLYGETLRRDQRYAGRSWDDIEPDVQRDWATRHPGSPWERFKDAVRHAWDRVAS